jgi:hypothetical protein
VETYGDDEYYREKIRSSAATGNCTNSTCFWARPAETYKETGTKGGKAPWSDFWDAKAQFSKVKALPASTFHKAQGMSVDRALFTRCIHYADVELAQQLLYVGVTVVAMTFSMCNKRPPPLSNNSITLRASKRVLGVLLKRRTISG